MEKELVSVIIPVYNVEDYLERCLQSVVGQSYDNLEIVLVDDGSTDSSGEICDLYTRMDNRIVTVHQSNQGVAAARNAGLDVARGTYISFVDADDYVDMHYIEVLYNLIRQNDCEISAVDSAKVSKNEEVKKKNGTKQVSILKRTEALEKMLYRKGMTNYMCGKMYWHVLFDDIRFPVGKKFEDVAILYRVLEKSSNIAISGEIYYYYIQREDSIVNQAFKSDKLSQIEFCKEIVEYIDGKYPAMHLAAISKYFVASADIYIQIPRVKEYKRIRKQLAGELKKYASVVFKDKKNKKTTRMVAVLVCMGIPIYSFVAKLYKGLNKKGIHIKGLV